MGAAFDSVRMSPDDWLNDRDTNSLDFLRVLAAVLVILSHSCDFVGTDDSLYAWSGFLTCGALGVNIFFFMSGMLITRSWLKAPSLPVFLTKRALRIYPGLLVAVLFCVLVVGPLGTVLSTQQYFAKRGTYAFLINGVWPGYRYFLPGTFAFNPLHAVNGSLWTLPYELLCYVGVLVAGKLNLLNPKAFPLLAVMVAGYVVGNEALSGGEKAAAVVQQSLVGEGRCYLNFLLGVAACIYGRRLPVNRWSASLVGALGLSLLTTGLLGIVVAFFALPFVVLFVAQSRVAWLSHWGKRGDLSYGMYIYAFPLQQFVVHNLGVEVGAAGVFGLSLLLIVPTAYLSWHKVERPALALGRRLFPRPVLKTAPLYAQPVA